MTDQIIADVVDGAARDDRAALVQLLHPYLHWTESGRTDVFARPAGGSARKAPAAYELRDGQSYRWTDR